MNKKMNNAAQGGFTLIELIVVIVILGILAATALPRFVNLGADARAASVRAAGGAINSAAALAHGQMLVHPETASGGSIKMEGTSVPVSAASLYPTATTAFAESAGLQATDYTITEGTGTVTISPIGAANPATCRVVYTESVTANVAPTVTTTASNCG